MDLYLISALNYLHSTWSFPYTPCLVTGWVLVMLCHHVYQPHMTWPMSKRPLTTFKTAGLNYYAGKCYPFTLSTLPSLIMNSKEKKKGSITSRKKVFHHFILQNINYIHKYSLTHTHTHTHTHRASYSYHQHDKVENLICRYLTRLQLAHQDLCMLYTKLKGWFLVLRLVDFSVYIIRNHKTDQEYTQWNLFVYY